MCLYALEGHLLNFRRNDAFLSRFNVVMILPFKGSSCRLITGSNTASKGKSPLYGCENEKYAMLDIGHIKLPKHSNDS